MGPEPVDVKSLTPSEGDATVGLDAVLAGLKGQVRGVCVWGGGMPVRSAKEEMTL